MTRRALALSCLLSSIGTGCFFVGSKDGPGDDAGVARGGDAAAASGAGLPCDVNDVLTGVCQRCHSSPPAAGAPMPLVTWDDTHAPSRSDPSVPVFEMMSRRIHDEARPMPPAGLGLDLDEAQLAALDGWLGAGAPMQAGPSCGATDGGSDPRAVGPDSLPCTPSHTFTAHAAGSTEKFHVSESASNLYECFTFRSPFGATTQGIAYAPIIDDTRVVHHWILYRTATAQPDGAVGPCNMPGDAVFVAGWAPGGQNFVMPDDIGLEMPGPTDSLILQIHYYNLAAYTDADDASGVAFCTTETPRANEAGVFTLGDIFLDIPPRSTDHVEQGTCPSWATSLLPQPVSIIGSFPHMHRLGTRLSTVIQRGGDPARSETLVQVDHWDFNSQAFYGVDPPILINPRDSIVTTCTYDNPTDVAVHFGERTEDEMCLNFVMVYPIGIFTGQRQCGLF